MFHRYTTVFFLLSIFAISGCQSTQVSSIKEQSLFHDSAFPSANEYAIESPHEIFALNSEAKTFVAKKLMHIEDPIDRMKTLMVSIFDRSDFNLLYDNQANTVAAETFNKRAANCLSMSIMTYSLAKHAGVEVAFQEVDVPEYWTRREGFSLLNGHINLLMSPEEDTGRRFYIKPKGMVVDFYPFVAKKRFPQHEVGKQRVISMFYNNKGADALISQDFDKAYRYLRSAINHDPEFESAWVNLGLLYRMSGHTDWAELAYNKVFSLNDDNLTAWENLAILYQSTGEQEKAEAIREKVETKRNNNPYYQFIRGEEALDAEDFEQALVYFRKAIRINDKKHQFYFGLAKSYAGLGDYTNSRYYLRKARRFADYQDEKQRYQSKLDLLASL
ncbi:tetratricopeptide repeat protein [Alteromonas sp. a30]|uniref:tetratricopeptide repeat protein n=1 Tax=Alteromonas sp. a30 TaxID=2730917 RepID=UPI00227E333D|nr:tetratricopeptide repeat protein [Alteromonas sp. a30]MCY7296331.1 hypothetical protein [Alteromonas sp. a30]